ncbi:MAG: hypothetical protein JWP14_2518 [Frankiales bacterium]|nr:hypothetical protein [Frankiales bacterium]
MTRSACSAGSVKRLVSARRAVASRTRMAGQHHQGDRQGGKPHEREDAAEKHAPEEDQCERASAANGYVHQHGHEAALRLPLR